MQDYSILPSDLETNPAILVILQPSQKMNHWPTCHVPRDIAVFIRDTSQNCRVYA